MTETPFAGWWIVPDFKGIKSLSIIYLLDLDPLSGRRACSIEVEEFAPLEPAHRVEALLRFECRIGTAAAREVPAPQIVAPEVAAILADKDCALTSL